MSDLSEIRASSGRDWPDTHHWYVIDKAPKISGKEIIGCRWAGGHMTKEPFITFWSTTLHKFYASPTHWIPMPYPPVEAEGGPKDAS